MFVQNGSSTNHIEAGVVHIYGRVQANDMQKQKYDELWWTQAERHIWRSMYRAEA